MVELPWIETFERVLSGSSVTRYGHVVDRAQYARWQVMVELPWIETCERVLSGSSVGSLDGLLVIVWVSLADFWACERVLERIVGWVLGRTVGAGKGLELCVVHPLTPWADRREGP
jgi:hypothetical protein